MKLFIGIPLYKEAPPLFIQSVTRLIAAAPLPAMLRMKCGDSSINRARNQLTADFLESDCDKLLQIDSDLGFSPDDIIRISSHSEPVVGGMYPLKREGDQVEWCGNGLRELIAPVREDGLQEVRFIGTGFLCVERSVFEKILKLDGPEITYEADEPPHRTEWDFWRCGVRKTADPRMRYLTEDWWFCQRWLDQGGQIFADTHVRLQHVGTAVWPLKYQRDAMESSSAVTPAASVQSVP